MTLPEAPSDVRVVFHDGSERALEVYYRGVNDKGIHEWVATIQLSQLPRQLLVGGLPAHTTVVVEGIDFVRGASDD